MRIFPEQQYSWNDLFMTKSLWIETPTATKKDILGNLLQTGSNH